jgi:hypothetical protein
MLVLVMDIMVLTSNLFSLRYVSFVMITGRYLFEMPEMPGGITELHPVYPIKILP